jgi:hypothetical protein
MAQAMNQPVDLMSFYIPHIDADIAFETIANVLQNNMEIGTIDRIEAVPKINQTDGHPYHTCFVYLSKWGCGYNAQFLRNQLVEGKETKLYYMNHRYWKLFANTSPVAKLPMPENYSLELYIPSDYTEPLTIDTIANLFDSLEFGRVSGIRYKQPPMVVYDNYNCLIVDFQYWYHSENSHQFQLDLNSKYQVELEPMVSDERPDMKWVVCKASHGGSIASNKNPYIYYHQM